MGMSSTIKDITPLVDSLETECIKDQLKSNTPASPRGKLNEEASNSGAEDQLNSYDGVGTSTKMKRAELNNTRYFIIKSLNHQNIQLSIKKGIWATQVMNEPILEEAFLELPQDIGEALCDLLDQGNNMVASLKRDEVSGDDFPQRRPYIETFHSKQDEDFNVPLVHMTPMLYPPLLYQHQSEASGFHLQPQRSCLPDKSSMFYGTSNVKQIKHCQINGSSSSSLNNSTGIDIWGLSADWSSLDGTLTEDDILEMSYEQYLEAHSQSSRKFHHSVDGPSASFQKSSSSKERSDDSQSASSSKKRTYRQSLE